MCSEVVSRCVYSQQCKYFFSRCVQKYFFSSISVSIGFLSAQSVRFEVRQVLSAQSVRFEVRQVLSAQSVRFEVSF